jgi:hypothetical protein|nr:MAG TPA: hypothetical protein [Caudoviricetes sp.]
MGYLLQIQDTSIDNAVTQVTKASVELAEAAANYGALKIIFGIFMVFIIIVVVLFVYQIFSLTKKMDIIHTAAVKTQEYFEGASDRTIGKTQAQVLIRRGMNSLSNTIKYRILRIRLENHIDDVELTKNKINRLVKNDFIEFSSYLSNFLCDDKQLSIIIDEQDIGVVVDFIIEQVYIPKDEFTVSGLDQSTDILVNGIKLNYLKSL